MRQDLIEKLRSGKAALLNNGDLCAINKILKEAFPDDKTSAKSYLEVYAFFARGGNWEVAYDAVDEDLKGKVELHPKDFFTEKKTDYKEVVEDAIKKAALLNKELRETLKLKNEIAEFEKTLRKPYQAGEVIEVPKPTTSDIAKSIRNTMLEIKKVMDRRDSETNLELNRWYKDEDERGCTFAYFQGFDKITYGIAHYGDWVGQARWFFKVDGIFEDNFGKNGERLKPASDKEVLEAIVKVLNGDND